MGEMCLKLNKNYLDDNIYTFVLSLFS